MLSNPAVSSEVKKSLLDKLAERMQLGQATRNFLFVLVDHHRVELLPNLLPAYDTEIHARIGIAEALVTSAHELSGQEKQELTAALERLTQKKVEAQFAVADSLARRRGRTDWFDDLRWFGAPATRKSAHNFAIRIGAVWRRSKPTKSQI